MFYGYFAWQVREKLTYDHEESRYLADYTPKSNISAFADLFRSVCFDGYNDNHPNHLVKDAKKLIKQCRAKNLKSRPTMENVVKEMETWHLT
ncbi:hypothetical protein M378DRAFT_1013703 [Amanita muscaria Koide BX008]|uniref:Uncharacterized protein n=1 Tax=Amanita muscaria (strain Koide BX008) TaxID=946122 RepID=A0A0C2S8V5_AMAMK|nr:hypothetical protein M378DRAFT_1013703 [Amanita muscaria Koide BX008]